MCVCVCVCVCVYFLSFLRQGPENTLLLVQEATADSIAAADLWEDALAFLGMLHQVGVQGFPATSLLSSCGRAEQWELSLDLFNSRRELGDLHSSFMRQAIYECCRGRSWSHALQLLSDIRGSRVKPNLGVFDFVIATCYRSGRWRNGLQVPRF